MTLIVPIRPAPTFGTLTCSDCGKTDVPKLGPTSKRCPECQSIETKRQKKANYQRTAEHQKAQRRARYQENRERELAYHRTYKYGITEDDIHAAIAAQGGVCPVCLVEIPWDTLSVDHDHETGGVRGILHASCNTALGMLRDNPDHCARAASYLRRPMLPLALATAPGLTVVEPTNCTVCGRHGTRAYVPNGDGTYRCKDGHRCRRSAERQAAGVGPRGRAPRPQIA